MNDADLGDNIQDHADVAEGRMATSNPFEQEQAHRISSRWWFASSAFPMIAGTLGPVASAFSICALVRPWRQLYTPGSNVQLCPYIPDPVWLTIVNAIQLAVAIVANLFLLLNMARRVRFSVAQPVTIVGWYISSVCLIALVATAAGPLRQGVDLDELIWSQAFFYGIYAAVLYFVVATLMVVTFLGALTGHYAKDFALTLAQRTLMLQTIMFLMYLLVGALVFSTIESWGYLDAVYWADVTLFTIGFGDYSPVTDLGRALLFPYALIGIISLGLVIGSIRSLILERTRHQMDARMEERKRSRTVRIMYSRGMEGLLEPIFDENAARQDMPSSEFERRRAEFELMREIQNAATTCRRWIAMGISTGTFLVLWLVGGFVFLRSERPYQPFWNYYDSVYFCFLSLTTVGYGDLTPISNAGKSFFVFWSLLALPTMTVLISNAGDTVVKFIRDATLRLGNITILPDDKGVVDNIKHVAHNLSFGRLFPAHSDYPRREWTEERRILHKRIAGHKNMLGKKQGADDSPSGNLYSNASGNDSIAQFRSLLDDIPTGPDLHYILICEIQEISKHLRKKEPRRYSFEEWAWYLKLMGEDEGNPDTHRKPQGKVSRKNQRTRKGEPNADLAQEMQDTQRPGWSWIGERSPLVGDTEEGEWIMDRLIERLKQSLAEERAARAETRKEA
ncbi:hypothetical protein S40288_06461 [Stachybotrys chartarum IBT 40288]|nr:hypothetical protein S40288_06461 [Stachybotrys chartarum IBT 40288]